MNSLSSAWCGKLKNSYSDAKVNHMGFVTCSDSKWMMWVKGKLHGEQWTDTGRQCSSYLSVTNHRLYHHHCCCHHSICVQGWIKSSFSVLFRFFGNIFTPVVFQFSCCKLIRFCCCYLSVDGDDSRYWTNSHLRTFSWIDPPNDGNGWKCLVDN